MAASLILLAKRALVSLLLALAQQYGVCLQISRESPDSRVESAFRSIVKKVHPDKGGNVADMQRLQKAMEEWRSAKRKNARVGGRPVRTALAPARSRGEEEEAPLQHSLLCSVADLSRC